jgi:hypothetical protein
VLSASHRYSSAAMIINIKAARGRHAGDVCAMQDLLKDWRRWTRGERVTAVLIVLALIGGPLTLALSRAVA